MTIFKHEQFIAVLSILILIVIVALIILLCYSHFNSIEIDLLVDNAIKQDLEYELIIHNNLTNTYTFNILH